MREPDSAELAGLLLPARGGGRSVAGWLAGTVVLAGRHPRAVAARRAVTEARTAGLVEFVNVVCGVVARR
jgi:hypothetical protein